MLNVTDSFIEYLSTNLSGIPVYWIRQTPTDENTNVLKQDGLNVKFLYFFEEEALEGCLISLDLLGSDERTVLGQLTTIRDLLISQQTIPELDYSLFPEVPQATGRAVYWEGRQIQFLNVRTPRGARYVHMNATFPLRHGRD